MVSCRRLIVSNNAAPEVAVAQAVAEAEALAHVEGVVTHLATAQRLLEKLLKGLRASNELQNERVYTTSSFKRAAESTKRRSRTTGRLWPSPCASQHPGRSPARLQALRTIAGLPSSSTSLPSRRPRTARGAPPATAMTTCTGAIYID